LLFAVAFSLAELAVTLFIGVPIFDAERFQLGIYLGFAFFELSPKHIVW
jgi:hypothetical protein